MLEEKMGLAVEEEGEEKPSVVTATFSSTVALVVAEVILVKTEGDEETVVAIVLSDEVPHNPA